MTYPVFFRILLLLAFGAILPACTAAKRNINVPEEPVLGHRAARTELIVFSDFQCPYCRKTAREIARIEAAHPNRVKVYFKHFPLDYHDWAEPAARAAEAARKQGKFIEMHDMLFAQSGRFEESTFEALAQRIGLDMTQFRVDFESPEIARIVSDDKKEGERLGVSGTPYIFINRTAFHGSFIDLRRELRL